MAIPDRPLPSEGGRGVRPAAPDVPTREALARRLVARYADVVDDAEALVRSLLMPLPATLWCNPLRIGREALRGVLAKAGMPATPMEWDAHGLRLAPDQRPGQHWGFMAGLYQVQEEVSMLPVRLLDPQPGERVLDLCAAPGNKTAQIAVAMANTGTVVANDLSRGRISAIRQTLKRLGLMNMAITVKDGQSYPRRAGEFDRVLVDAPCTCEGTFRKVRVPQIVSDEFRQRTASVQLRLLRKAVQLTRPGGRIVYSTCTFSPEENEAVVDAVLREQGGVLRLLPMSLPDFRADPGLVHWADRTFDPQLRHSLRIWPHRQNTGGFFVAVLEKAGSGSVSRDPSLYFQPPVESDDWLKPLTERFGIPATAFRTVQPVRRGARHLHLLPVDHRMPQAPAPDMLGLPAVRRKSLPLKPTTAAILLYGDQATCNFLNLNHAQFAAFLKREGTDLLEEQLAHCERPGYVVVRYQGLTVGLGQLIRDRESPRAWLRSLMPKAWSLNVPEQESFRERQ